MRYYISLKGSCDWIANSPLNLLIEFFFLKKISILSNWVFFSLISPQLMKLIINFTTEWFIKFPFIFFVFIWKNHQFYNLPGKKNLKEQKKNLFFKFISIYLPDFGLMYYLSLYLLLTVHEMIQLAYLSFKSKWLLVTIKNTFEIFFLSYISKK